MDIEHPDITHTRLTGYPRHKKAPARTGANKNTHCGYYNTEKGGEVMHLIELIKKEANRFDEFIKKIDTNGEFRVNFSEDSKTVQFHCLDDFIKISEGETVFFKNKEFDEDFHIANFYNSEIDFLICLDDKERQELECLINE